jgi:ubiquinone/menaquinone biosynthesis C-methylase UbiE
MLEGSHSDASAGQKRYVHQRRHVRSFAARTAERDAAFFIPHLTRGMTLLDCGSGPGTITVGLAKVVAPGEVVGIDNDETQVNMAAAHAEEQEVYKNGQGSVPGPCAPRRRLGKVVSWEFAPETVCRQFET